MTELLDKVLHIFAMRIFFGLLAADYSLVVLGSCAQCSEGRVSALQHAVCLIVKFGAMWAFLDLRSLSRMDILLLATVAAVPTSIINVKGTMCSGPK
jgi:hypothetical protein